MTTAIQTAITDNSLVNALIQFLGFGPDDAFFEVELTDEELLADLTYGCD